MAFLRSKWAPLSLIVVFLLLSYWRVAQCGFIWDDDDYVTENPVLRTWGGLASIWFEPTSLPQYYPLVHSSFWLEYRLWGLSAFGYHLVNVILHGVSAFVLLRLGRRLAVPGIWFASLWFLVHPVHVESVAWITERKNVLSLLCYLLAAERWLRWHDDQDPRSYMIGSLWLLGALWSKTVTASLPAALLIVIWWRDGKLTKRAIMAALPWFVVGAALGWYTVHLEATHVGAADAPWQLEGMQRILVAGGACWFYFGSLLWPFDTCFNYPRWDVQEPSIWLTVAPIAAAVMVVGTWLLRRRIGRGPCAMLLLFGGTLVPAIGFFDVYPFRYSFIADHFQYHASVGVIVAVSAFATKLLNSQAETIRIAVAGVWLVVMSVTTMTLLPQYDSFERLWTMTLEKNPRSALSLVNLGGIATDAQKFDTARDYLTRALAIDDTSDEANANLGVVEHSSGNREAAKKYYLRALELAPNEAHTRNNLAVLFLDEGNTKEAIRLTTEALAIDPNYLTARGTLGYALAKERKWQKAIVELEWGLRSNPMVLEWRLSMATCLLARNEYSKAAGHALFAIKNHPQDQESRRLFAKAMAKYLRSEPAVSVRQKAVAAIQKGGVVPSSLLPLIAAELRSLGANAQASAISGS